MEPDRKRRILIVDDEPAVCGFLATALGDAGYDVTVATDGRLKGVDVASMELALVDIFMPERDGFEVIQHLRKSVPQVAIVAMTGDPNYHGMQALDIVRRLGADATLSKPFALKAVLSVCSDLLARPERPKAR
jgi:DNA-binding response OmpR family regulator